MRQHTAEGVILHHSNALYLLHRKMKMKRLKGVKGGLKNAVFGIIKVFY